MVRRLALALTIALGCTPEPAPTDTDGETSTTASTTGPGDSTTTGPTTTSDDSSSTTDATSTSTSSTDTTGDPVDPGCGDGVPAPGELCFEPKELDFLGSAQESTLADLDGDGHLDILAVEAFPCPLVLAPALSLHARPDPAREGGFLVTLRSFLGDGAGGFTPGPVLDNAQHVPRAIRPGEFTGDGLTDIAGISGSGGVVLFTATGGGAVGPGVEFALPILATALAAGHLDDDARLDLVAVGTDGIAALRNDGVGGFIPSVFGVDAGPARSAVALFDLDANGHLDLVVGRFQDEGIGAVGTHINAGNNFFASQVLETAGDVGALVVLAPAANARPAVIALVHEPEPVLRAFIVDDDGLLAGPQPVAGPPPRLIAIGRLDGDDRHDLLLAGPAGVDTILGQDPWPPAPASISLEPLDGLDHLAVGDINEDGVDDVLLGQHPDRLLLSNP